MRLRFTCMHVTDARTNNNALTVKENQCSHHYLLVLARSEGDTTLLHTSLDQLRPLLRRAVIRKKR